MNTELLDILERIVLGLFDSQDPWKIALTLKVLNLEWPQTYWKVSVHSLVLFQVTIEVVDDPQMEVEMDLAKEGRNDWSLSSEQWFDHKKLFWPIFWEYHDSSEESPGQASLEENGEDLNYDGEDSLLSGVGVDWGRRWKGWDSMENYGKKAMTSL